MERHAIYPDLAGKVAIVTGIGQIGKYDPSRWGNGAHTARLLCKNGVQVFGCDIDMESADRNVARIRAEGGTVDAIHADVTKAEDVKKLVAECMAKYGRIDILVDNVGRSAPGCPATMDEETWDLQHDVNIKHVYLTLHEVLPIMKKQRHGAVVTVASIAGLRYIGKAQVAYSAFKAAVIQLTKTTAVIYAGTGVRLNTVVPGLINTPLTAYLADKYANGDLEGFLDKRNKAVPVGQQGDSRDIANAVVFLSSDSARYITGTEVVVDGGIVSSTG